MIQGDLVARLDSFFNVSAFSDRELWTSILSPGELAAYERKARREFLAGTWNGLMLDSTPEIDRVYTIVFPGQAVFDTILALELDRDGPGALIFAHHPVDFEERGRGFVGLSEAQFEELREHRISYYCCHAPLDCHPEVSTVSALAKALKLRDWEPFAPHQSAMEGVHGRVTTSLPFDRFAEQLAELTELPYIRYDQIRFNAQPVDHVAVIPGGGDNPRHLEEAAALGCDTYVTGVWWLQGDYDYAKEQRRRMHEVVPRLPMNLIGTSHYASEMVVLRDQMIGWFRNAGIEAKFIRQENPFR